MSWAYPKVENVLHLIGTDGMISREDKILLYKNKKKRFSRQVMTRIIF